MLILRRLFVSSDSVFGRGLLLVLFWLLPVAAGVAASSLYNPRPAEGDIVLPMPEGAEMVFRVARVEGSSFWGDRDRVIQLGDASGGVFEGLQRTQISGSFPTEDGTGWLIVLAKYELTKGQFLAVMGLERFLEASADPEDRKLPELRGRALREALTLPLTYVSHQNIQEFIRLYPGFIRLPTEEEWEYVARDGLPALESNRFDDRLPFPPTSLDEHAWHLGNARHSLRPIGLRAPSALGFFDLFGNAQEMTAGVFRPEIWQGKPGGVTVRGGSVSTPAGQVRSALRAELDAYAWNSDLQQMEERRSFNTGARLAIGTNVVVSSAQREAIEAEYDAYRTELRRSMPVGRTMDNLVAQASVQLGTVEPILARLMDQDPSLRDPLTAVQAHMERAREQLELAQRETARSLAQDATRNGVNLSVYLSRLHRLAATRDTAMQLLEISSRYRDQVEAVEATMRDLERAAAEQLQGYREKIGQLGDYDPAHIEYGLEAIGAAGLTARETAVLVLLEEHLMEFSDVRRADPDRWLSEFRERFADFEG